MEKKTYEERQIEKASKVKILKPLIIAECNRIIQLLEADAESKMYGYNEVCSSELFNKMKELRRDTINLEKVQKTY